MKALKIDPRAGTIELIELTTDTKAWLSIVHPECTYLGHTTVEHDERHVTAFYDDCALNQDPPPAYFSYYSPAYNQRMDIPGVALFVASNEEGFLDLDEADADFFKIAV